MFDEGSETFIILSFMLVGLGFLSFDPLIKIVVLFLSNPELASTSY